MRVRLEALVLLVVLPFGAWADPRSLVLVPHPLEFDPRPELTSAADKLKAAWIEALRETGDVVTPTRKEVDAALGELARRDCRTSNDCLASLATKGAGLYAAHATLELTSEDVFVVTARVVRDDGRLMGTFTTQAARVDPKKRPLAVQVKALFVDAVKGLGVAKLPSFKEATALAVEVKPAVVEAPKPTSPPAELPPPPPPPAPSPPASGKKVAAFTLIGAGAAVGAVGGVLLVLAQTQARALSIDGRGFLPSGDEAIVARANAANTMHFAGLGLLGGGVVGLAVGALVLLLGEDRAPSAISVAPVASGLVLGWSGRLP